MTDADAAAVVDFENNRDLLFGVAYRLPTYLEAKRDCGLFLRLSPGRDLNEQDFQQIEEVFRQTLQ